MSSQSLRKVGLAYLGLGLGKRVKKSRDCPRRDKPAAIVVLQADLTPTC